MGHCKVSQFWVLEEEPETADQRCLRDLPHKAAWSLGCVTGAGKGQNGLWVWPRAQITISVGRDLGIKYRPGEQT